MARAWPPRQSSKEYKSSPRFLTGRPRPFRDWVRSISNDSCGSPASVCTAEGTIAEDLTPRTFTEPFERRAWSKSSEISDLSSRARPSSCAGSHRARARLRGLEPIDQDRRGIASLEQRMSSKKRGSGAESETMQTMQQSGEQRTVTTVLSFQKAVALAKQHKLSISTIKSALEEFRDLGKGREFLTLEELDEAMRRRCGLLAGEPIPATLRAAALLSFEGEQVSFEEFLLWSQSTTFVEETLVRSPKERHLRQLARDHRCDFVMVEALMKLFRSFDTDRSGYIEWDEFRQVVCAMLKVKESTDISEARLLRYWKEADHRKMGRLDFEQFLLWYASNGTQ